MAAKGSDRVVAERRATLYISYRAIAPCDKLSQEFNQGSALIGGLAASVKSGPSHPLARL